MEGGHTSSLIQLTAFLIVLGGTIGAVLVSNSMNDLRMGMKYAVYCFIQPPSSFESDLREVLNCAQIAKKESVLALEKRLNSVNNEFLRDALSGIDG